MADTATDTISIATIAKSLIDQYNELGSWGVVAGRYGLTKALVWRVANEHYEPHKRSVRAALGLPAYHSVVVVTGGDVPPGSQVISASQCACGQWFISNHPRRRKCFVCSPYRKSNSHGR